MTSEEKVVGAVFEWLRKPALLISAYAWVHVSTEAEKAGASEWIVAGSAFMFIACVVLGFAGDDKYE